MRYRPLPGKRAVRRRRGHHPISADGQWLFVLSQRYAAWVEASAIAEGGRDAVLGYMPPARHFASSPGPNRARCSREQPRLSELQLDMGTRIPLADVAVNKPVSTASIHTSWILDLPMRNDDGRLAFAHTAEKHR